MFAVVQEIQLKRPVKSGDYREYEVSTTTIRGLERASSKTYYSYGPAYDKGCFERPVRTAYKISIHESYREFGRVKKKQCAVGTIGFYPLVSWGLYDYIDAGIKKAVEMFGVEYDVLYQMAADKMEPIRKKAEREFHRSEEYRVTQERAKVLKRYQKAKAAFAKKYSVDAHEYDACYNVFGEVMNQPYLDEIIRNAEAYRSYYGSESSTYNDYYSGCSTFHSISGTYTEDERAMLKKFYKTLSIKFHPDVNPDTDTTKEMQLLNKLKESWGV